MYFENRPEEQTVRIEAGDAAAFWLGILLADDLAKSVVIEPYCGCTALLTVGDRWVVDGVR